jgi:enoyl-CoA hydratase/carnithine racemase
MPATSSHDIQNENNLLRSEAAGIVTLTLNRPAQRNCLSRSLMDQLEAAIDSIHGDANVRVVILAANGPAFCAGHDIGELRARNDLEYFEETFHHSSRLMLSLIALPQPVIACVQGVATAAGCQLVATCDLAVAAESAKFATPGVDIGLFCSTPQVALTRNIGRKAAMEMLLTGTAIDAHEAKNRGLVNRVVADADLGRETLALAKLIASKSSHTTRLGKAAFYRQSELTMSDAYAFTSRVMAQNMLDRDAIEGLDAFLEKRKPVWADR